MHEQYFFQITKHLENKGYKKLNPESNNVYGRTNGDTVYIVVVGSSRGLEHDTLKKFNNKLLLDNAHHTGMSVELLNILLTPDGMFDENIKKIIEDVPNVWLFTEDFGKLYVFENQPADFDGLYDLIDKETVKAQKKQKEGIISLIGVVTPLLVVLNILSFSLYFFSGDNSDNSYIVRVFADNYQKVVNDHEYYRMFTAMFVHFSLGHIFSNMVVLIALGARIENLIGRFGMLISYVVTGLVASAASLYSYHLGNYYSYSGGASGAIFGLLGIMIALAILNKGKISDFSLWNLAIMSVLTVINGFMSEGVDNWAHIGGLVAGLIIGFIIPLFNQKVVNKRKI